jgi:hypothetical protein
MDNAVQAEEHRASPASTKAYNLSIIEDAANELRPARKVYRRPEKIAERKSKAH